MTSANNRTRVRHALERFSEIVFGLIMVLSFTGALSVAEVGREDIRIMLLGAIGCNLAWGIIDAAFYLLVFLSLIEVMCLAQIIDRRCRILFPLAFAGV